jgi:hypothetical protein
MTCLSSNHSAPATLRTLPPKAGNFRGAFIAAAAFIRTRGPASTGVCAAMLLRRRPARQRQWGFVHRPATGTNPLRPVEGIPNASRARSTEAIWCCAPLTAPMRRGGCKSNP